jgi:NAD(P)-dependent dehydrogenase (short-subunit alcohol dehydrogenase family)
MTHSPGNSTPPLRALVTGSASGLGRATAEVLREHGWTVVGLDLRPDGDDRQVDVADLASVTAAVEAAVEELGGLDGVAHCAGAFRNDMAPTHLMDPLVWDQTLQVNLSGSYHVARATLPHLMRTRGALTLVASIGADNPQPGGAAYAASKAGVSALAGTIAVEYGPRGVRCNAVLPGYMVTGMTAALLERDDLRAALEREVPLNRVADAREVAQAIAHTLSPEASYLSGARIVVDGAATLTAMTSASDVGRMWRRHQDALDG